MFSIEFLKNVQIKREHTGQRGRVDFKAVNFFRLGTKPIASRPLASHSAMSAAEASDRPGHCLATVEFRIFGWAAILEISVLFWLTMLRKERNSDVSSSTRILYSFRSWAHDLHSICCKYQANYQLTWFHHGSPLPSKNHILSRDDQCIMFSSSLAPCAMRMAGMPHLHPGCRTHEVLTWLQIPGLRDKGWWQNVTNGCEPGNIR